MPEQFDQNQDNSEPNFELRRSEKTLLYGAPAFLFTIGAAGMVQSVIEQGEINPVQPGVTLAATAAMYGVGKAVLNRTR